jgi:hypothetical protein
VRASVGDNKFHSIGFIIMTRHWKREVCDAGSGVGNMAALQLHTHSLASLFNADHAAAAHAWVMEFGTGRPGWLGRSESPRAANGDCLTTLE